MPGSKDGASSGRGPDERLLALRHKHHNEVQYAAPRQSGMCGADASGYRSDRHLAKTRPVIDGFKALSGQLSESWDSKSPMPKTFLKLSGGSCRLLAPPYPANRAETGKAGAKQR